MPPLNNSPTPLIVTLGRGYRSLIDRYTDTIVTTHVTTPSSGEKRFNPNKENMMKDRSRNIHALIWRAEHWAPM